MANIAPYPLVDISLLYDGDVKEDENFRKVGAEIVKAFQETGYVYLKHHDITLDDVQRLLKNVTQFFDLDEDTKMKYKRNTETFHGYSNEKHETVESGMEVLSKAYRNSFDIQGLDEPFPDQEVPQMRQEAKIMIDKLLPLVFKILRSIEEGLGMKENFLADNHKLMMENDNYTDFRSMRYMPPKTKEHVNRFGAHYDYCTITLQLYADLEGLELLDKEENWKKCVIYPGYILLFPSEILQRWSGGKIQPLKHRVMIPEDESLRVKPRHAVILFVHPDNPSIIEPFDDSKTYEPITAFDFAHLRAQEFYKFG